jgi:hypothetical protein
VQLSATTELDPDIVVIQREQVHAAKCTAPPLLVVEIRSPSTALIDLGHKKAACERFGVPLYWIVDPRIGNPSLTVFELVAGHYRQTAPTGPWATVIGPRPHSWRRKGASVRSAAGSCASSSASAAASARAAARDRAAKSPSSPLCPMHHCVHSGSRRSATLA